MKKVVLVVALLLYYFTYPKFALATNCLLTAAPTGSNNGVDIVINNTKSGWNYSINYYQIGNASPIPGPSKIGNGGTITMSMQTPSTGIFRITAQGVGAGGPDFCNEQQVTVTGGNSPDALKNPPKGWLKSIIPDFGPAPVMGINFFKTKLIPFIISLMLFLLITLSLIFLIIGGLKYMTSGGNKEGVVKAKGTITYALIGLTLGLGAFVIVQMLFSMFNTP